jgi:hypothetical protein
MSRARGAILASRAADVPANCSAWRAKGCSRAPLFALLDDPRTLTQLDQVLRVQAGGFPDRRCGRSTGSWRAPGSRQPKGRRGHHRLFPLEKGHRCSPNFGLRDWQSRRGPGRTPRPRRRFRCPRHRSHRPAGQTTSCGRCLLVSSAAWRPAAVDARSRPRRTTSPRAACLIRSCAAPRC